MSASTPRRSTRRSITRSMSRDLASDIEPELTPATPSRRRQSSRQAHLDAQEATPRRRSQRLSATPTPTFPVHRVPSLDDIIKEENADEDAEGVEEVEEIQEIEEELVEEVESQQGLTDSQEEAESEEVQEALEEEAFEDQAAEEEEVAEEEDDVEASLSAIPAPRDYRQPEEHRSNGHVLEKIPTPRKSSPTTVRRPRETTSKKINSSDRAIRRLYLKRKILNVLSGFGPVLRPALIVAALILLALLPAPMPPFSKNTYVDENALQPGQANVYWGWDEVGLCDEIAKDIKDLARQADAAQRAEYISSKLLELGLDPHTQQYDFDVPTEYASSSSSASGVNTYARWLSGRSDGREAVIIAASWLSRWDGSDDPDPRPEDEEPTTVGGRRVNVRGNAIVLALAKYLSSQSHWSKDIIFVFSDGYMEGMQAWSTTYFGAKQSNLHADPLTCTGAVVWNSIAVDYPSDSFASLVVLHEGVDGQLPNMDVLNGLVKIAERMGRMPVHLPGEYGIYSVEDDAPGGTWGAFGAWLEKNLKWGWRGVAKYQKGSANLLQQVKAQAIGHPSGIHGLFQRFHVDAITVYASPAKGPYGFWNLGRMLEAMVRSFSNLLERLHHSQFFYLLTMPDKFVPLGVYLPVALLMSVASTLMGIAIWMQAGREAKQRKSDLVEWTAGRMRPADFQSPIGVWPPQVDLPLEFPTHADLQMDLAHLVISSGLDGETARSKLQELLISLDAQSRPVASALLAMGASHAAGAVIFGLILRHTGSSPRLVSAVGSLAPLAVGLVARQWAVPTTFASSRTQAHVLSLAQLIHAFTLLETGMAVAILSILNFSAAIVMALLLVIPLYAIYTPPSGTQQAASDKISKKARMAALVTGVGFLLVLLPWNLPHLLRGFASLAPHLEVLLPPSWSLFLKHHLVQTDVVEQILATVMYDWYFLGTAFLPIVSLVYTPIVLQAVVVTLLVVVA